MLHSRHPASHTLYFDNRHKLIDGCTAGMPAKTTVGRTGDHLLLLGLDAMDVIGVAGILHDALRLLNFM
jgi:hypothetical protein